MPTKRSHEGTMFGLPADTIHTWSNGAYIIAIAVAAVLTFLIYQSSSIVVADKERALEAYKADADLRVADARREAELAKAVAEQARTEQTRLQVDLEHEKTSRAEFEAQFSWRVIDEAKRVTLVRELSASPKTIAIEYAPSDQEATFLALQLIAVFRKANWTVMPRATPSPPPLVFGLDVPGPQNDATKLVISAFTAAGGATPDTGNVRPPSAFMGDIMSQFGMIPDCRLVVGPKPTAEVLKALSAMKQQ